MSTVFPGSESIGCVVEGSFTLLRRLGATEHSSVFLVELAGDPPQKAAVKFVAPGNARNADWTAARALSHPHLIPLLASGRCTIGEQELDYVVMEYAEEVLSEILAERPLTPAETAEMLPAVVDALAYLHELGLVHGRIAPSNILAAGDSLKLSVDTVRPAGERSRLAGETDAPEMAAGELIPATDVWSLGVVLVEALSRERPAFHRTGGGEPVVPAAVPEPFASIARDCLRVDPARRCTLAEIRARLAPAAKATHVAQPVSAPVASPAAAPAPAAASKTQSRFAVTITVAVVLIGAAFIAAMDIRSCSNQERNAAVTQSAVPPAPASAAQQPAAETPAKEGAARKGAVVHQVMPDVPQPAMETINGHVRVEIRVDVGTDGNVSNAAIEQQGPSRYFAESALNAASEWTFQPPVKDERAAASTWLLHFAFAQSGVEATAEEMRP